MIHITITANGETCADYATTIADAVKQYKILENCENLLKYNLYSGDSITLTFWDTIIKATRI